MTTPETHSVELERITPSFDEVTLESEEVQLLDADVQELSAYTFDSDDETLVGLGSSRSASSNAVGNFDISDRTLVGIGPVERGESAEQAELAELTELTELAELALARASELAEATLECVPMPASEPPGPFVYSEEGGEALPSVPMHKAGPWLFTLFAALLVMAFVLVRRGVSHPAAPSLAVAAIAQRSPPAEVHAVERPVTPVAEVREPAVVVSTAPREKPPELALRHAVLKSARGESPLGTLDVSSTPPSSLVLDGRPLGKTPRVLQLTAGPHTVVFVHPDRGRVSVTVSVRPGRTTNASADF